VRVEIKHQPAFALAVVALAANEEVAVEPGAMVSFSDGVVSAARAWSASWPDRAVC
jgi:hypothetical protein